MTATEWESIRLKHDSRFLWVIGDDEDTTVGSTECPYDRYELSYNYIISIIIIIIIIIIDLIRYTC